MLSFVSLPIELVRTRPRVAFGAVLLAQSILWLAVAFLFYRALPGRLPEVLAIGHHFPLGGAFGPPLAYWLAEIVFRALGRFGLFALSQLCILATFGTLFVLGRAIVGSSHAAIALLLTAAMGIFAWSSPEFGPAILTMPIWALLLLHTWRVLQEGRRWFWLAIGIEVGLLILTSYANLVLVGLWLVYVVARRVGRQQFASVEPFLGGLLCVLVLFPHLVWLDQRDAVVTLPAFGSFLQSWAQSAALLAVAHLGALLLVALAVGWTGAARAHAPTIERPTVSRDARGFVLFFALAPWITTLLYAGIPEHDSVAVAALLVMMSGLAIVILLGNRIRITHQRLVTIVALALVGLPPLVTVAALTLAPVTLGRSFDVTLPAGQMGRFFASNFERRIGRPLPFVTGDDALALQVAARAPSRPSAFRLDQPDRWPWVNRAAVDAQGAVVVWRATDTRGAPPPTIAAAFPGIVPEVPQVFARVPFWSPPQRVGWAVIRPQAPSAAP